MLTDDIKTRLNFSKILSDFIDIPAKGNAHCFNHDDKNASMQIFHDGAYCHTCCRQFDVFDVWEHFHKLTFLEALAELALLAGIPIPAHQKQKMQAQRSRETALEIVAGFYERRLWSPEGKQCLAYAQGRGWTDSTIKKARLGYAINDRGLAKHLHSLKVTLKEIMSGGNYDFCVRQDGYAKSPDGFLIYPHIKGRRVKYLAARSITPGTKEHRNLPGKKHPYFNWLYSPKAIECRIVEGQACAISFAELGKVAIGQCGAAIEDIIE